MANGTIWRLHIDGAAAAALTDEQARAVVLSYVEPTRLAQLAAIRATSQREVFSDLLPTERKMQSGDFGEILTATDLPLRPPFPRFPLFRWRLRAGRNDTVRGVDLMGIAQAGQAPSPEDTLVLCEVKTRASRRKKTLVGDAYNSVVRDYTTRLAEQLLFHQTRLLEQGDQAGARALSRFLGRGVPSFRIHLIVAVVHETRLWNDADLDHLPAKSEVQAAVEVHVTCVDNLAQWIDEVLLAAIGSCDPTVP